MNWFLISTVTEIDGKEYPSGSIYIECFMIGVQATERVWGSPCCMCMELLAKGKRAHFLLDLATVAVTYGIYSSTTTLI